MKSGRKTLPVANDPSSESIVIPASQSVVVPLGVWLRMCEAYLKERDGLSAPRPASMDPALAQRAEGYAKKLNLQSTFVSSLEPGGPSPFKPSFRDDTTGRADDVEIEA